MAKGDVLGIAQVAGIMAAKQTSQLIPLCHPLILNNVDMDFYFVEERNSILIRSIVMTNGKTGVEMEALLAVTVAALTIYDICKAIDRGIEIGHIHLVEKNGGASGHYQGKSYLNLKDDKNNGSDVDNVNNEETEKFKNKEKGTVVAICIGDSKKAPKKEVATAVAIEDFGLEDDIHAGVDHKQISLLSLASLEKNRNEGYDLNYGDLFENIVFLGIEDLYKHPVGTIFKIGQDVVLRITQIGKDHDVEIVVDGVIVPSIMPKEGIFDRVIKGGLIRVGDAIEVIA